MSEENKITGTVSMVNTKRTGLKLEGHENWYNFTAPDYRDGEWHEPKKGEEVTLTLSRDGKWVREIILEKTAPPTATGEPSYRPDYEPGTNRRLALTKALELVNSDSEAVDLPAQAKKTMVLALAEELETWLNR